MGIFDNLRDWLLRPLMDSATRERITFIENNRKYRRGVQPDTMKVRLGRGNDNVTLNLVGLAVNRSVSLLFGKGVEFNMEGEGETPEQLYIDKMYELNRKEILLHKVAVNGAEAGTAYIKIHPDWYEKDGVKYPRLVSILPETVTINTDPEDMEIITGYTIEFWYKGADDKSVGRKQEIFKVYDTTEPDDEGNVVVTAEYWTVEDYEYSAKTGNKWQKIDETLWPYAFPPMIHTQNLPAGDMAYGEPDITADVLRLQDKINYNASNEGKIIKHHAHPKTLLFGSGTPKRVDDSVDEMWILPAGSDAKNLEMESDLSGAQAHLQMLRNTLMDITRTVDISSHNDKLGALTNFGIHVLFMDALQKLATKRELYGEMLTELNRRCLELADMTPVDSECVWPDPLPSNMAEVSQALQTDLAMGIVSKQTIAKQRGYIWEDEQKRMADEQTNEGDIGTRLLEGFMTGRQNER